MRDGDDSACMPQPLRKHGKGHFVDNSITSNVGRVIELREELHNVMAGYHGRPLRWQREDVTQHLRVDMEHCALPPPQSRREDVLHQLIGGTNLSGAAPVHDYPSYIKVLFEAAEDCLRVLGHRIARDEVDSEHKSSSERVARNGHDASDRSC